MREKYRTKLKSELLLLLEGRKEDALTAKEIHARLQESENAPNLASVYRQLDRLVEERVLVKSIPEHGKSAVYLWSEAGACYHHLHMQCTSCGRLMHLDCHDAMEFMHHLSDSHDFFLSVGKTVLYGECGRCRKQSAKLEAKEL